MNARGTPRLDALLKELLPVLEPRGRRSQLARIFQKEAGISLPAARNRVSRILARDVCPNAEDALILQEFTTSPPTA